MDGIGPADVLWAGRVSNAAVLFRAATRTIHYIWVKIAFQQLDCGHVDARLAGSLTSTTLIELVLELWCEEVLTFIIEDRFAFAFKGCS